MARKRVKRTECPNCGHVLHTADNYCANCGQENHTHKLPIRHFIVELLAGMLNFDTKLVHTLRDLFAPPGLVVSNYNQHMRARYVPPLRLYLFVSVLFFIVVAWLPTGDTPPSEKATPILGHADPDSVASAPKNEGLRFTAGSDRTDSLLLARARLGQLTDAVIDSMLRVNGEEPGPITRKLVRTAVEQNMGGSNRKEFTDRFTGNVSKAIFFTLPFFALLLYLLNWRRRGFFTEHLVFALYEHVVVFALLLSQHLVNTLTKAAFDVNIFPQGLTILLILVHLVWSMRTVYQRSWLKTVVKTVLLLLAYSVIVALALAGAVFVTALT